MKALKARLFYLFILCFPVILTSSAAYFVLKAWGQGALPRGFSLFTAISLIGTGIALFTLSVSFLRAKDALARALETLRASESRTAAILESSLDSIISMDHQGLIVEWNAAAEKTFGYTRQQAMGQEMASLIIPSRYKEAHRKGLAKYLATGEGPVLNRRIEIEAMRADEMSFPVELAITRIGNTTPPRFTGFLRDITERRRDERARSFLSELNLALQRIVSPDEIMAVTARFLGEYMDVDRCAYADVENKDVFVITGDYLRGVSSIVGRWPVAAFGGDCLDKMLKNEAYVVFDSENDPRIGPVDLPAYRATAIRSVICVPLHRGGKFTAAIAVHQKTPRQWSAEEIELVESVVARCWESLERAKAARDLREHAADLLRTNQRLEQFAYVSSHDLQEPLRKILTYGDRLQKSLSDTVEKDYLERMQNAALRMKQVIEDLLQYSKIARTEGIVKEDIGLRGLLVEVLSDLELQINESGAKILLEGDGVIRGSRTQIRHLFQNLFTNSLKFAKKDVPPEIVVAVREAGPFREVSVSDNGIGFDEQYAQKIFQPFQRLHGRTEYEGTGIGLAIVQTIVQNHGGTIVAKSRSGEGATFVISLPA